MEDAFFSQLDGNAVRELLLRTDMTVTQIALESGFNNTHTFYTAFRSVFGQTPAEYLRAQNAATPASDPQLPAENALDFHENQAISSENTLWPPHYQNTMENYSALNICGFNLCMPPAKD